MKQSRQQYSQQQQYTDPGGLAVYEAFNPTAQLRAKTGKSPSKPLKQSSAVSANSQAAAANNNNAISSGKKKQQVDNNKRLSSTDQQQRYMVSGNIQQHHPSVIYSSNKSRGEAVINKSSFNSPKQSTITSMAQRLLTKDDLTPNSASKDDGHPMKVMGLGHGMGIQLGQDGRFYASMGGQTALVSPQTSNEQQLEVTNSYPGPQNGMKKSVQKLPSSQKIKSLISSNDNQNRSEQRKQMTRGQQSSSHKLRDSKLNEYEQRCVYEEILNSAGKHKLGSSNVMQSFRQQPFSQSPPNKHHQQQVQLQSRSRQQKQQEEIVHHFNSNTSPINSCSQQRKGQYINQMDQRAQRENIHDSREVKNYSVQNHYKESLGAAIAFVTQSTGAHKTPQTQTQRMNSTNESSFTEPPPNYSKQLQLPAYSSQQHSSYLNGAGQQIIAVNPPAQRSKEQYLTMHSPQLAKGYSGQTEGIIPDTRSYIVMKNKVEGDSKQLKHEVAQQIIATVQKNRIAGAAQIHTCRNGQQSYGKQLQVRQSNLPPLSQPLVSKTEVVHAQLALEIAAANMETMKYNDRIRHELLDMHLRKQLQSIALYKNQPSSQLCKNKNQLAIDQTVNTHVMHRHNSMEQLTQSGSKQVGLRHRQAINGEITPQPAKHSELTPQKTKDSVYKTVMKPHLPKDVQEQSNSVKFSYRVMSEKRASQPTPEADSVERNCNLIIQAVDQQQQNKRNSIQVMISSRDSKEQLSGQKMPQKMAFVHQGPLQSPRATTGIGGSNPMTEPLTSKNRIFKQEVTLEGHSTKAADETSEWIGKVTSESPYLSRLQSHEVHRNASGQKSQTRPGKQSLVLGQPHINIPALQGAGQQYQLQQKQQARSPQPFGFDIEILKKPDQTESNVKRARLMLDKKKKLFEKWPMQDPHNTFMDQNFDGAIDAEKAVANSGLMIGNGVNCQHGLGFPTEVGKPILNIGGNLVCVPGLNYKSMLPAQIALAKHQSKMKNLAEHPLNNQQLLNGFSKNTTAAQQISRPVRKANQDRAFQANQGIQGKNINMMNQNKVLQNIQREPGQIAPVESPETKNMIARAIEAPYETPQSQELRNLHMLQQQLLIGNLQLSLTGSRKNLRQSVHAADTGQIQALGAAVQRDLNPNQQPGGLDAKRSSAFFQLSSPNKAQGSAVNGSQVVNNVIVFSHNGQTYIRSKDVNYPVQGLSLDTSPGADFAAAIAAEALTAQGDTSFDSSQRTTLASPASPNKPALLNSSQATMMAEQMVQMGIGSRSLSKMLQGAQLEAALQQLAKAGQLGVVTTEELQTTGCIQQLQLKPPPQHSPRMGMKQRSGTEKITKLKYTSSPSKYTRMYAGESNGSLSTKPATSTTMNSTQEAAKHSQSAKKGAGGKASAINGKKEGKQRIDMFHAPEEGGVFKSHKINKAIKTINNIIRLIFKNNKDSLAITTTSNQSSALGGPSGNRLIEDTRIAELHKIAKQINIQIPKKFDSKQSLREFFHSREFILNLKIKMQNLLHKAILTANNMPQSVIEMNMCGKDGTSSGAAAANGKEESKIYVAKKFFVGPGNNFAIVKSVLKQRYWWQYGNEESFAADCDFIWTSWKKQKHIDFLTGINKKQRNKKKLKDQAREDNLAAIETKTDNNESKSAGRDQSESKMSRKRKEKKEKKTASDDKDPLSSKANIEKVVLPLRLYNRLEQNKQLTNKKGVFVNMRKYYESIGEDPFKVLPVTFHTTQGIDDVEFRKFSNYYNAVEKKFTNSQKQIKREIKQYYDEKPEGAPKKTNNKYDDYYEEIDSDDEEAITEIKRKHRAQQNTWIIKPGENTNRGVGIQVVKSLKDVQAIVGRPMRKESDKTFIIQKYIDYPLLVHKRKFDFRCFGMLTSINGSLKGYCYQDGYARTSCREYSLDDVTDPFVHLTNDAIQQRAEEYGKFENGNKMSFQDFTKVINAQQPDLDFDFHRDIFPQITKLIADTYKAAFHKIDPNRLQNCFELFGYDFMIDEDFRLYLIEVNTNPSLEVCSPLLARIIPELLDNCFKIVLDPLFPSPDLSHNRKFQLNELPQEIKFLLVFDENVEGEQIRANFLRGVKLSSVDEEDIESDKEQELAEDDGDDAY